MSRRASLPGAAELFRTTSGSVPEPEPAPAPHPGVGAVPPAAVREATVEPIATADWPTKARRPPDSRLDCSNLHATFGLSMPHWRESLSRTVEAILAPSDTAALQAAD